MDKINISFVTYAGLSYGGAHRQSMNLAKILNKDVFNVRYFWCKHEQDRYSNFSFPQIDLKFIDELRASGVETTEFRVGYRDISNKYHAWKETDFFEVFNTYKTDIVLAVRSGHAEYPFVLMDKPIVEWNVFGGVDNSENIVYSVAVSPWIRRQYLQKGGKKDGGYCYYGLDVPVRPENIADLRAKYGISEGDIAIGFHQRKDDNIFSDQALRAWKHAVGNTDRKLRFVILGGSEKYKDLARELGLEVLFLPIVFEYEKVSEFLSILDVYSHSAGLGETLGIAVQEAMMHQLPVVAMYGENNGHVDVIGDTIEVAKTQDQYDAILLGLVNDDERRRNIAEKSLMRAKNNFSVQNMKEYFEKLLKLQYENFCRSGNHFRILTVSDCDKLSLWAIAYRCAFYFPPLMRIAQFVWPMVKNIKKKINGKSKE